VFAAADHGTVEDLHASTLTVWLRINRKAPHLDLRWRQGLHVPFGASDDERARQVDAL
jgi:hypothetical protein